MEDFFSTPLKSLAVQLDSVDKRSNLREGAILYGSCYQKKRRDRGQVDSQIPKNGYRLWYYSGGPRQGPLQISG